MPPCFYFGGALNPIFGMVGRFISIVVPLSCPWCNDIVVSVWMVHIYRMPSWGRVMPAVKLFINLLTYTIE
jgi:hypothetical protein